MIIVNAHVLTMDGEDYPAGYIVIQDGIITRVGDMADVPFDADRVDAQGGYAMPGMIDAHCHIGLFGDGIGIEGEDGNEGTDPVTPQLRAIDGINMMDRCFADARNAGVTTVMVSPGSANVIGGQVVAMKTAGTCVDDAIIKQPAAIKVSLGENPKKTYGGKHTTPATRMGTAALLRQALLDARHYEQRNDNHGVELKHEGLLAVLSGQIPLHVHAHRADDICTALRIAKEFHLSIKIVHGTEGYLVKDKLTEQQVPVLLGPIVSDRSKPELAQLSPTAAKELCDAGVGVALVTDHPELPIQHLLLSAQLAAKNGMDSNRALAAITCDAAAICDIDDVVGKIAVGYHGDVVIFDKNPLDFTASIRTVYLKGEKVNK